MAVNADFGRYQPILDRRPFGGLSADLAAGEGVVEVAPVPVGPSFADKLQLCALTLRGERVFVGFVDNNENPAIPYFLYVGESDGGYDVLEAQFDVERVRIRKGTEERWIGMGGVVADGGDSSVKTPGVPRVATAPGERVRAIPKRPTPALTRDEYLRQRREGLRPMPRSPRSVLNQTPADSSRDPEWKQKIREYNMDLIRAGGELGPALPIELTPDEDAQLVSEGVLAPAQE